jgi:rhamnulose-1-phosphate aldolase
MTEFSETVTEFQRLTYEIADITGILWQRGWAERNAGNISVNISGMVLPETAVASAESPLARAYPGLEAKTFLLTASGKRMRDLAKNPGTGVLILRMNDQADGYRILMLSGDAPDLLPTSELPTHLGIHAMIAERGSNERVVMHTHATELIALTQAREFCDQQALNHLLMGMHPEIKMFIPKGVGFVPYQLPGSEAIASETLAALQNHDAAVWEKHGVFAIGESVSGTFDTIDILAKSAGIYLLCRSARLEPEGLPEV